MIVTAPGVMLGRSDSREADRAGLLYTREYGKVPVRFIGVNRPAGKLKALSEPMVLGDYRLHLRKDAPGCRVLGGALVSVYPNVRRSLPLLLRGLQMCEWLHRLTPLWQPSPAKYDLLVQGLAGLDSGASPAWVSAGYGLQLLEHAGFGLGAQEVAAENRALWRSLHRSPLDVLGRLPEDAERQGRLEDFLRRKVSRVAEVPLRGARLLEALA